MEHTSWENFLNPEKLRSNLIRASIYITIFELLENSIVVRLKDFYTNGFDQNGWKVSADYESKVLSRNRSPVYASLEWLKSSQAISDADLFIFEDIKGLRNVLAHQFPRILHDGLPVEYPERFAELVSLLDKIERWWLVNFELALLSEEEIGDMMDVESVIPGRMLHLNLLLNIALGSEHEARQYYEEWVKLRRNESGREI